MRLVLASASPRRRELLAAAGIAFIADPVHVDERLVPGETPAAYVERLAIRKARAGAERHPDAVVLGADTAVVFGGKVYGKPSGPGEAASMLHDLSGSPHEVMTAIALVGRARCLSRVETTMVWMRPLTGDEIEWYVASGEPLDKAGAYAIQGLASRFIPRIAGSYANVVGLPVATLVSLLRELEEGD